MRIISGRYRGRKLIPPRDNEVRPTTDRIKETVFNILAPRIPGARVLDLFAGSGALGIECLSRGADEVIFVDRSPESVALVHRNLKGLDGNFRVVQADYAAALGRLDGRFDIVFIDPPYGSGLGEKAVAEIFARGLLEEDGVICYEHSSDRRYEPPTGAVSREKRMGAVTVDFVRKKTVGMVTGTFDPFTRGHEAVVKEALRQFDEVVVACLVNPEKECMFTPSERVVIARAALSGEPRARVIFSEDTAVDTMKREGADALVRGLRGGEPDEYETAMADYNRERGADTVFVSPDISGEISSTAAREALRKGDFRLLPEGAIITVGDTLDNKRKKGDATA